MKSRGGNQYLSARETEVRKQQKRLVEKLNWYEGEARTIRTGREFS